MGLFAFTISVIAAVMSFFQATRLPAFIIAIVGIIYATVTGYMKTKNKSKTSENKTSEGKTTTTKVSEALEVGAAIISGVVCFVYIMFLWF